jgi:hypothetical protein
VRCVRETTAPCLRGPALATTDLLAQPVLQLALLQKVPRVGEGGDEPRCIPIATAITIAIAIAVAVDIGIVAVAGCRWFRRRIEHRVPSDVVDMQMRAEHEVHVLPPHQPLQLLQKRRLHLGPPPHGQLLVVPDACVHGHRLPSRCLHHEHLAAEVQRGSICRNEGCHPRDGAQQGGRGLRQEAGQRHWHLFDARNAQAAHRHEPAVRPGGRARPSSAAHAGSAHLRMYMCGLARGTRAEGKGSAGIAVHINSKPKRSNGQLRIFQIYNSRLKWW